MAIDRWRALGQALQREAEICPVPVLKTPAMLGSALIGLIPLPFIYLQTQVPSRTIDLSLIVIGVTTLVAIWLRWRMKLSYNRITTWREAFSVTHTAFALGCIPAVVILLCCPDLFSQQQHFVQQTLVAKAPPEMSHAMIWARMIGTLVLIGLWAAVTEEVIYRGLIVSVIRRWSYDMPQKRKDLIASLVGGAIFGLAHLPTWGPLASIALFGLGFGFSLGFIANGEKLMPLIIYHFVFDMVSMSISVAGVFR